MKIVGKASIRDFTFETSKKIKFGEYVIVKNIDDEDVLSVVKNVYLVDGKFICDAKVIGVLKDKKISVNKSPISSSSDVELCSDEILSEIFYTPNGLNIGSILSRENIRVYLDTNKLVSRHFAILAVTGGGKSNTVAVLCKEFGRKNASLVVLDPHGEYSTLYHEDLEKKTKVILPTINPSKLTPEELADLIGLSKDEEINKKRIFLEYAYYTIKKESPESKGMDFIEKLGELIYEWVKLAEVGWEIKYYHPLKRKYDMRKTGEDDFINMVSLYDRINKFKDAFSLNIGDKDMIEELEIGKINIINLSGLEIPQMTTLVGYIAKNVLSKRILYIKSLRDLNSPNEMIKRNAMQNLKEIELHYRIATKPVVMVVEEAHIFIPINEKTPASLWLGKIAREGRKFGVGLGLVSQRPKQLDPNVLSQTNTKIVLRIVEPEDQKYIQRASEDLGEDLVKDLASLGIGEAVIVGAAISLPSIVKIDRFDGIYGGKDIDIVREWMGLHW
ncbi:MAG: ATP-binding protein [Methanococci archaeon]|nr:ATP-binding protein [Methanococci archaeon]